MQAQCMDALKLCEHYFRVAERRTPPPQWVPWEGHYKWRYVEKLPQQALLQKLARQITGLKSLSIMLSAGFLQEVGVLFRVLDEISEDVSFISLGLIHSDWTENHRRYLEYFWRESDADGPPTIQRKKIRAFVNRRGGLSDPSSADRVGREIHQAYSDYIHARSAPIMAMVKGPPPNFFLDGIRDPIPRFAYEEQVPSYFYRALGSAFMVIKVSAPTEVEACYRDLKAWEVSNHELIL